MSQTFIKNTAPRGKIYFISKVYRKHKGRPFSYDTNGSPYFFKPGCLYSLNYEGVRINAVYEGVDIVRKKGERGFAVFSIHPCSLPDFFNIISFPEVFLKWYNGKRSVIMLISESKGVVK
ncbi:MAG: hypothetical protein WCT77_07115 [Bacteroidota bacterium]|jgi:hypothetical protein